MTKTEAMQWAGGTQEALAERLGISQGAISQWPDDTVPEKQQYRLWMMSAGRLKLDEKYNEGGREAAGGKGND